MGSLWRGRAVNPLHRDKHTPRKPGVAFQGLEELIALELAKPCKSLPKLKANRDPAHHQETKAAVWQEIRDITSAPHSSAGFSAGLFPVLSFRNVFNQHRPLVTTVSFKQTRILLPLPPSSPPPLSDNTLSSTSRRGAEPNFHYPKCQPRFLSALSTAGSLRQPLGESKWNKAPTNNCIFPGPGLTRCPCHIRSCVSPLLLVLGVKILISGVSRWFSLITWSLMVRNFSGLGVENGWAAEWGVTQIHCPNLDLCQRGIQGFPFNSQPAIKLKKKIRGVSKNYPLQFIVSLYQSFVLLPHLPSLARGEQPGRFLKSPTGGVGRILKKSSHSIPPLFLSNRSKGNYFFFIFFKVGRSALHPWNALGRNCLNNFIK